MSKVDLNQIEFTYKNLEGVARKCIVTPLRRKEAAKIFHETLLILLQALSVTDDKKGIDLSKAVSTLSFDKIWEMADQMLRFAIVDGTEIKSLDETDFFEDKPEELYQILIKCIMENFPGFFTRIQTAMKSGLPGLGQIVG